MADNIIEQQINESFKIERSSLGSKSDANILQRALKGVDEQGKPLAQNTQSAQDAAWQQYLMPSEKPTAAAHGFQTASLRQQAMRRKRDMRPRFRPQPQLRARKK